MNKVVLESGVAFPVQVRLPPVGAKTCIVTSEIAGPFSNGGIGTTNRALASILRVHGFEVDVLYTQVHDGTPFSTHGQFVDHVAAYRKLGVNLMCVDHPGRWNDWQAKSYLSMQHLLRNQYDLVFFDDTHGTAYYPLLARRTGNTHLRNTLMCVTAHAATQWISDLNLAPVATFEELRVIEMERRSIELADALKAPSSYILRKYRNYGWVVPDNSIVLPNFIPEEHTLSQSPKRIAVKEIVFFGRLENRKGLWMFCRALDRLKYKLADTVVTFLGRATVEDGVSTAELLLRQSATWPFQIRLLNNFDHKQALAYLKGDGRLAIMPSPEDNSPSTVLECLTEEIPFLACSGSGGEELVDEQSRQLNMFEPSVDGLCEKLLEVLKNGASTGRRSIDEKKLERMFSDWIERLLASSKELTPKSRDSSVPLRPILIIVIPPEFNTKKAAAELRQVIRAYHGRVEIEVLTENALDLQTHLKHCKEMPSIRVSGFDEFGELTLSLSRRESTVVGLCHITQLLLPTWIERARNCFDSNNNIAAVTGMVAVRMAEKTAAREPFISALEDARKIDRYLMGNASALFPLLQESNSGFVLMRSELLGIFSSITPFDKIYGRLKRMEDWIHEVLMEFHSCGKQFELVPDEVIEQAVVEAPFEVFRLGHFMRSSVNSSSGHPSGTDQSVLARLAVDTGLNLERDRANAEYLKRIEEKIGRQIVNLGDIDSTIATAVAREEHLGQLAAIAHCSSQIELAIDLCAIVAIDEKTSKVVGRTEVVRSAVHTISLIDAIAANMHKCLNLDYDYSLRVLHTGKDVVIHVNPVNKGLAAIIFPSVDLSKIDRFRSEIEVPEKANPIRFRLEFMSLSKLHRWSADQIVCASNQCRWDVECPTIIRDKCKVLIGVEMVNPDDSVEGAFARWVNPRFIRHV